MSSQPNRLSYDSNPLTDDSPEVWGRLIEHVGPASLLVVIQSRMGAAMKRCLAAEDVLQEAFLRAWGGRFGFEWRGLKSFRAWLLTLIDHCIADAATRESAQKRGGGAAPRPLSTFEAGDSQSRPGAIPEALVASTTPSRIAMYKEQAAAVETALESLPADLQQVVRLRVIEQLPVNEVAARMGIGPSAVRHRLYKGAELYRQRLAVAFSTRAQTATRGASGTNSASQ